MRGPIVSWPGWRDEGAGTTLALNVKNWLDAIRAIDRLLELEAKHGKLLELQAKRIDELVDRVGRLEVREQVVVAEAKGAAASAASAVASHHVSDLARRVGGLDERVKLLEAGGRRAAK